MYIDKDLQFSDSQPVTVSAPSTNSVDQGSAGDAYVSLWLVVQTRVAATAAGSATVNFQLQTDDDPAFGSPKVLYDSGPVGVAALTANSEPVKQRMPRGTQRYIRLYYVVGTGPLTAGEFSAFLAQDVST